MNDAEAMLKRLRDDDFRFVDFRFTDPRGAWHHMTYRVEAVDERLLEEGFLFDGSSIAGWKAINESDMLFRPDLSRLVVDPFAAQAQAIVVGDVEDPAAGQPYGRDPRGTARRALAWLRESGVGDEALFGPEPEFFVFDSVRFEAEPWRSFFDLVSEEAPSMSGFEYPEGNLGHRPGSGGGYVPAPPVDGSSDLRAEMLTVMAEMGLEPEKHHHEVAPGQNELGVRYGGLLRSADDFQILKYAVRNVAHQYGKTATFMPKPVLGENGSGMHVHQSIRKGGRNLFYGEGYAGLSETALHYIGGVIRHARALNALTNPTTNSYKRLVPGYEAPVLLAYSSRNRSAAVRIPFSDGPESARIEVRFPDPSANPYLAFSALLMAGIDGVRNRIHPGDAMDKNLYDLPPEQLTDVPHVASSLDEALAALRDDSEFLLAGGVFSADQLESLAELRAAESSELARAPHPLEFRLYYSVLWPDPVRRARVRGRAPSPPPAPRRPPPPANTPPSRSRFSRVSRRCAAGPECTRAAPTRRRCTTSRSSSSTTRWTRCWRGRPAASRSPSNRRPAYRSRTTGAASPPSRIRARGAARPSRWC